MELNEIIGTAIEEIKKSRERFGEKRNYLVDELTIELSVSSIKQGDGKIKFEIFNFSAEAGGNVQKENAHKITIKLKPRNNSSHANMSSVKKKQNDKTKQNAK